MPPNMTPLKAFTSDKLFRSYFGDLESWRAWFTLIRAAWGEPLGAEEFDLFKSLTGRERPPSKRVREFWAIAGRRSGKTRMLAFLATYMSLFVDFKPFLSVGERGVVVLVAPDRKQATVALRYIKGILAANPVFAQYIVRETSDRVELSNGIDLEVATCSYRTIRGRTLVAALLDEVAFWYSEDSVNPDSEVLGAIKPAMVSIPEALLLVASTPYAQRGILYQAHRDYYGQDTDDVLVVVAPSVVLNPTLDAELIRRELEKDPESASAEYLAVFRRDLESYINREAVQACVVSERYELAPVRDVHYSAFVDPAGGSGKDAMTLAIGHRDRDGIVIVDALREVRPPFSPDDVTKDFATLLRSYRVGQLHGDRYAGEWPRERFRAYGITYEVASRNKNDLYKGLLPVLNAGTVELLDHARLVNQICALERRTARGGRDSIDHGPGQHDDLANAVAGLVTTLDMANYLFARFL